MIERLVLPAPLRGQMDEEARRAFPRECCGLIEGICEGGGVRAIALRPMTNLATEPDRFEIDPLAHFALLHRLHGSGRRVVGCYHSHPNGKPEPSERDRENAAERGFLWLIAALDESGGSRIAAFVATASGFAPVRVAAG